MLNAASQAPGWFVISTGEDAVVFQTEKGRSAPAAPMASNAHFRRAEEIKMALISTLKEFIASGFASIENVERVYTLRRPREEVVYVRVVLPQSNPDLRRKVYAKEKEIIDAFEVFEFDFGIVASHESVDLLELVYKKL